MCICILPAYMCVCEGIGSPEAGVTGRYELPCGTPLEEHSVLLIAVSSLQLLKALIFSSSVKNIFVSLRK